MIECGSRTAQVEQLEAGDVTEALVDLQASEPERLVQCSCGQPRARCRGKPVRISVCHCLACRSRTGSAFSVNATYPELQVRTEGQFRTFTRAADSGRAGRFHFCPNCGATVFYDIDARPGMISIPVGMLADPAFPAPTVECYPGRRSPWCTLDPAIVTEAAR